MRVSIALFEAFGGSFFAGWLEPAKEKPVGEHALHANSRLGSMPGSRRVGARRAGVGGAAHAVSS